MTFNVKYINFVVQSEGILISGLKFQRLKIIFPYYGNKEAQWRAMAYWWTVIHCADTYIVYVPILETVTSSADRKQRWNAPDYIWNHIYSPRPFQFWSTAFGRSDSNVLFYTAHMITGQCAASHLGRRGIVYIDTTRSYFLISMDSSLRTRIFIFKKQIELRRQKT